MEQAPQHSKDMEKHMALLREQYPDIREDSQYFIFDVTDKDGNTSEVHLHKWEKIPVQVSADRIVHVPVWKVIEAQLRFHHLFGRDDFSLVAVLQKAGALE